MSYEKRLNAHQIILTITVAGLLLIVPASIAYRGNGSAFAAGYGNGQYNGANNPHSNSNSTNDHPNNNSNATNDHGNNGNQTGSNNGKGEANSENAKGPGDDVSGHGHNADERMKDYVSESAEVRHHEHLSMNESITGPYTADLNYTVNATGKATDISDSSNVQNASLTLNLSIWKSTPGVVSMDIINGKIKIGNNSTQIFSGHAYYLINKPRLLVYGFIVDNGMGGGPGNSTSEHSVRLIKLYMSGNGTLPANSSDPALQLTVLSPQSKLVSEWFLDMSGEVQRS